MASDLKISNTDFSIWVGSPHHSFAKFVNKHDKWTTNSNTLKKSIILKLNLSGLSKFTVDTWTPDKQFTFLCYCCRRMPCWQLSELSRLASQSFWPGVQFHGSILCLSRVISYLTKVVGTTCPDFTLVTEKKRVKLSTAYLLHPHAFETLNFGGSHYSILQVRSQTKLPLISISADKNFIGLSGEDRMTTACFYSCHSFVF